MALTPGTRLGPYEIVAPLGAGGMGEVYRARDPRLGREVAIKVLPTSFSADADRLQRFEQEARAAAALNHPNILTVHEIGAHNGVPYVVSELLEGQTLRQTLNAGAMSTRKTVEYAVQIANGLAAAHEKAIVHRDLKPENLFITRDGRVKILDFGLAKLTEGAGGDAMGIPTALNTDPGTVLGTSGYMSPEQIRGEAVDARSDIFSLGTVLYEMFAGTRAFQRKTPIETMSAILKDDPAELSSIPPALDRIVRRCLEKGATERFQSARDVTFALEAVSTASGSAPRPAVAVERSPSTGRRAMLAAGAVALIALGVLVGRALRPPAVAATLPEIKQLTFEHGLVESARFAPDGQSVVYAAAWEGRDQELFSVRADRPESHPLGLTKASVLGISGNGEMALTLGVIRRGPFIIGGTLARTPLVGGTPREMLENVEAADWASDGNQIAVIRRHDDGLYSVEWPAGHVVYSARNWISHLRISPDGQLLAFADHPVGGDDGTLVVLDRSAKQKLSVPGWASIQGVAWNPDGSEVWFTATRSGGMRALHGVTIAGRERVLYRSPIALTLQDVARDGRVLVIAGEPRLEVHGLLAGGAASQPLSTFDWATQPSTSDDGSMVVYGESGEGSVTYGIYLRRSAAAAPVRLGDGWYPTLSHDVKWVAALSRERDALSLLPVGAGEPRRLERGPIASYVGFADWLPDSKRLVFTGFENGSTKQHSYVQAIDGPPKQLQRVMGRPSPDGTRCLCRDAGKVGVCRLDSDTFESIPNADDLTPAGWTDDGKAIYAYPRASKTFDVYRVDPATGVRTPFKAIAPGDQTGLITIGGLAVSPTGNAFVYSVTRTLSQLYVLRGVR